MSPGLRDPTGMDGSEPPKEREAMERAFRDYVRRVQPGLALILDRLATRRREKRDPGAQERDEKSP